MPSNALVNGQHRWYRLFLPLSVALLAHTLIIVGIVRILPEETPKPIEKVRFTLVEPGSDISTKRSPPSVDRQPSTSESAAEPNTTLKFEKFTIPPITAETAPKKTRKTLPTDQTDRSAESVRATPKTSKKPDSTSQSASQSAPSEQQASNRSIAATPSTTGQQTPTPGESEAEIPRFSEPSPEDPYKALLWEYISKELDNHPVAKLRDLDRVRVLQMELRLLESGVVRRVDIIKSSGSRALDAAARRSALGASPYPEPPESARGGGYRFQVELRFSPNRDTTGR